jgi:hypothetical protein
LLETTPMSIWKDQNPARKDSIPLPPEPVRDAPAVADFSPTTTAPPRAAPAATNEPKESLIAADLTIESGAKLNGGVRAKKVTIAGELEGNIEAASRVELLSSGVIIGDLKAGSLTVAAGSRMRGQADFGWDDSKAASKSGSKDTEKTDAAS